MAEVPGRREARTRVTFFLPQNDEREELAIHAITRYLRRQRTRPISVSGFTHGLVETPMFVGSWWYKKEGAKRGTWFTESVILFIIDYARSLQELKMTLGRLEQTIKDIYEEYGSKQAEVWVIAQQVTRYAYEGRSATR